MLVTCMFIDDLPLMGHQTKPFNSPAELSAYLRSQALRSSNSHFLLSSTIALQARYYFIQMTYTIYTIFVQIVSIFWFCHFFIRRVYLWKENNDELEKNVEFL
jgi:hypothetical protein